MWWPSMFGGGAYRLSCHISLHLYMVVVRRFWATMNRPQSRPQYSVWGSPLTRPGLANSFVEQKSFWEWTHANYSAGHSGEWGQTTTNILFPFRHPLHIAPPGYYRNVEDVPNDISKRNGNGSVNGAVWDCGFPMHSRDYYHTIHI